MRDLEAEFPAVVSRLTGGEYRRVSGGITFRCPLANSRHAHGDRTPSCRLFVGRGGALMGKCHGCGAGWVELKAAAGLTAVEWFPESQRKGGGRRTVSKVVARYVYRHPDGRMYGTKLRLEPKSFLWERPLPDDIRQLCGISAQGEAVVCGAGAMEEGHYRATRDAKGVHRFRQCEPTEPGAVIIPEAGPCPLFLSEQLEAVNPCWQLSARVYVCEGEKDTLTAQAIGLAAVCGPHGANIWTADYSRQLAGRRAVLVPHYDAPGTAFMERVAGSLLANGVRELCTLKPTVRGYELAEGEDLTDWATRQGAGASRKLAAVVDRLTAWVQRED